MSETPQQIKQFSIHDALTNEALETFESVTDKGEFLSFKNTYILDFSTFKLQGAFYIKAGLIYSPTIYINKNVYLGTADFLLNYMRQQRIGYNKADESSDQKQYSYVSGNDEIKPLPISETKPTPLSKNKLAKQPKVLPAPEPLRPKMADVQGGWHETPDNSQFGMTSANAIFQLLFAYQMNPTAFTDAHDATGKKNPNGIPDILDEAKWGLDWLLKMYPGKDSLYHQIDENLDSTLVHSKFKADFYGLPIKGRQVYIATGKPQGSTDNKNHSTGIASIAGKYASAFALGANIFTAIQPAFAETLSAKAIEVYEYGKKNPGTSQSIPGKYRLNYQEENWADDMELAATQLYRLTYNSNYLREAADYGRMEPITPWLCSDTARHHQWYPFLNIGHYMLANVENPRYQKEFSQNMLNGIQRMSLKASENPFQIGVPLISSSNHLVTALATQCRLYRTITSDSTYLEMETALTDWLFGRNPWGSSMIIGLPKSGDTPVNPYSEVLKNNITPAFGGMVNGPVHKSVYINLSDFQLPVPDKYERYQSEWAVYHDDAADWITNQPTIDGTASLAYLLSGIQKDGVGNKTSDKNEYDFGGIIRSNRNKKQISLVFTGHEYADGYKIINKTLKKLNIKAAFFLTGDFYRNRKFAKTIKGLQKENHYLGAHSDKHLLYSSWHKRDSLFLTKQAFLKDLKDNYKAMEKFGIQKKNTPFFIPPFEWYNDSISQWSKEVGVQLINYTPGTLSNMDNSTPEMRANYYSSIEIFNKIMQIESNGGLNGYILSFHIGSDKRRQDKFYPRLYSLLIELSRAGYDFVDLYRATDIADTNVELGSSKKQKRKN